MFADDHNNHEINYVIGQRPNVPQELMIPQEEIRLRIDHDGNFDNAHGSVMDELMMGDSLKNGRIEEFRVALQ